MDKDIRMFELEIIDFINKSSFPLELKRLVLVEVLLKVSEAADNSISMQKQENMNKEEVEKDG